MASSSSSLIERRPKTKKAKLAIATKKYGSGSKGRKPAPSFQKKLVVVDFMGDDAPKVFTLKEPLILLRGMLPDISTDSGESTIRSEISSTIKNADESLSGCLDDDFEFLEATGKTLCVPAQLRGFEWTGKAVKGLAGSGSVYVRLRTDVGDLDPRSGGGKDLSPKSSGGEDQTDVSIVKVEQPPLTPQSTAALSSPSLLSQSVVTAQPPSAAVTPQSSVVTTQPPSAAVTPQPSVVTAQSPLTSQSTSQLPLTPQMTVISVQPPSILQPAGLSDCPLAPQCPTPLQIVQQSELHHSPQEQLQMLSSIFPSVAIPKLQFLLELTCSVQIASDCLLQGPTLDCIVSQLYRTCITREEPRQLRIDEDDDEDDTSRVEAAIAFYKGPRFGRHAGVRISVRHRPAIDTGGVRRQFFSEVFSNVASSEALGLFEGAPNCLRPAFRQSSISSGMLALLGTMVGHSIVLDCQGFPFLSPSNYYYMAGRHDKALSLVSLNDVSERVAYVITKVCEYLIVASMYK